MSYRARSSTGSHEPKRMRVDPLMPCHLIPVPSVALEGSCDQMLESEVLLALCPKPREINPRALAHDAREGRRAVLGHLAAGAKDPGPATRAPPGWGVMRASKACS